MNKSIFYRKPIKKDAKHVFNLVKDTKVLDVNSEYLYLLQCTHFQNYCSVAQYEDDIVGFVSAYLHPEQKDVLFVWQVGVDKNYRGNNIAQNLILDLLQREWANNINYVYTTISPSNTSSQRVFEKLSLKYGLGFETQTMFEVADFNDAHEDEVLYKIKLK
jgi:L-2,4-diaminobutyric acid acetyltransferase